MPLHPSAYPLRHKTREKLYRQRSTRELMEFYIFFFCLISCPRFRARSRFRFDSLRPRLAILNRTIYSTEYQHDFELNLSGDTGASPTSLLLSLRITFSSETSSRVVPLHGNNILLRKKLHNFFRKRILFPYNTNNSLLLLLYIL